MFNTQPQQTINPLTKEAIRSITQTYSPKYRKNYPYLKKNKKQETLNVQSQYDVLNKYLERIESGLNARLQTHQEELLGVFNAQIKRILDDVRKIVKVYNKMINQKNLSDDLWETRNEAEYFKSEAERLFKQNSFLKKESELLRKENREIRDQLQTRDLLVKKLKYRAMKMKNKKCQSSINLEHSEKMEKSLSKREETQDWETTPAKAESTSNLPTLIPRTNLEKPNSNKFRSISQNANLSTEKASDRKNTITTTSRKLLPYGKQPHNSHANICLEKYYSQNIIEPPNTNKALTNKIQIKLPMSFPKDQRALYDNS